MRFERVMSAFATSIAKFQKLQKVRYACYHVTMVFICTYGLLGC